MGFEGLGDLMRSRCLSQETQKPRWLAQRLHRSFGSSVDVNPRFLGWLLLVNVADEAKKPEHDQDNNYRPEHGLPFG